MRGMNCESHLSPRVLATHYFEASEEEWEGKNMEEFGLMVHNYAALLVTYSMLVSQHRIRDT
jgi:hypothetical protein